MKRKAILFAVLAAVLYAASAPFSKILLRELSPAFLSALLYLGAGIGVGSMRLIRRAARLQPRAPQLARADLPWILGVVALNLASALMMTNGLSRTTAANASLLGNFELVATALIALLCFHEAISRRLWIAVALVTSASLILSFESAESLSFSVGSLLVMGACTCWGLENNCTRKLSAKDPTQTVTIKGFGSGLSALAISAAVGGIRGTAPAVLGALLLGFVSYGLSSTFYVTAQRSLGAARTSAFYALSPFFGAALSFALLREIPTAPFLIGLAVMIPGVILANPGREGEQP